MDDKPPQPSTTKIDAIPQWAAELSQSVTRGFTELRADVQLVATDVSVVKDRVRIVEKRLDEHDTRATANSMRVRVTSEVDLKQDAELAKEKLAREELAARVEGIEANVAAIRKTVTDVLSNPKVLAVGRGLFLLLAGYAASKGIRFLP